MCNCCRQGYGHITPKTNSGRVATIIYAVIGIPLTLLTITHIGGFMATSFRWLYRTAKNAHMCCRKSSATADPRKLMCVGGVGAPKPLFTVRPVDLDRNETHSNSVDGATNNNYDEPTGSTARARVTSDVSAVDDVNNTSNSGDLVPIKNCVPEAAAAVAVAMASMAASTRRQSTIVRLTRLRQQFGVGLHSADSVRVPIWLSVLFVFVYIALGAVMFSVWESVGVTSESTLSVCQCSMWPRSARCAKQTPKRPK